MRRLLLFASIYIHVAIYHLRITAARHAIGVELFTMLHYDTAAGVGSIPYIQRPLVPWLLAPFISTPSSAVLVYLIADILATCAMLTLLYVWCRQFVSELLALVGMLLTAFMLPLMFNWWFWSVSTPVEVCLFLVGFECLRRMWYSARLSPSQL